jgi:sigma-E factor negative regulatory protein RseA
MNAVPRPSRPVAASAAPLEEAVALSTFVDGELPPSEIDALLRDYADNADARANWQAYHLIGDVLRGASDSALPARSPQDFVSGISRRLAAETVSPRLADAEPQHIVRPTAANDAVIRWKLVAGLASLAAVVAVSWTLVDSVGSPAVAGPQLAAVPPPVTASSSGAVVVQTAQGQVLRDARLEELLAEHRQYGGMSALQMPAGFLRNATYDAAPQR